VVPFFALAIAAGATTAWVEHALIGAQGAEFELSLIERVLVAGRAVWFYMASLVWPFGLVFQYPRWTVSATTWWQYLFPLSLAALMAGLWRLRARTRGPLAALLLFGAALAPALGFVNVFPFRYSFVADHFQYTASLAAIGFLAAALTTFVAPRIPAPANWLIISPSDAFLPPTSPTSVMRRRSKGITRACGSIQPRGKENGARRGSAPTVASARF